MKRIDVVCQALSTAHHCDTCNGVAGDPGLHANAVSEIRRLQRELEAAATKLHQVITYIPIQKAKAACKGAAIRADNALHAE